MFLQNVPNGGWPRPLALGDRGDHGPQLAGREARGLAGSVPINAAGSRYPGVTRSEFLDVGLNSRRNPGDNL
jgi:hypothetical protein